MRLKSSSARFGAVTISCTSSRPRLRKPIERRQADDDGVEAGFEIEIAADARDAIGYFERRLAAAAFVEQVRQSSTPGRGRIDGSTDEPPGTSSTIDATGTERCATARSSRPLASAAARCAETRKGAVRSGNRQLRAIDAAHETVTSVAPGSASSRWPRGTTLERHAAAASTSH